MDIFRSHLVFNSEGNYEYVYYTACVYPVIGIIMRNILRFIFASRLGLIYLPTKETQTFEVAGKNHSVIRSNLQRIHKLVFPAKTADCVLLNKVNATLGR